MLILRNACFIHFPKTGGHWVRKALVAAGIPFEDYNIYGAHIGINECPCLDKFKFAFVRHPVSFFRSYWQFKMTDGWDENNEFDMECKGMGFEAFVEYVTDVHPGGYGKTVTHVMGQGANEIEFIGRYEHLVEDLITALKLAGEEFDEELIRVTGACNVSDKARFPAFYTDRLQRKLMQAEREMMTRFGYDDIVRPAFNRPDVAATVWTGERALAEMLNAA